MRLYKSSADSLVWEIEDSAGNTRSMSLAAAWATHTWQQIVARWSEAGGLGLWMNGVAASGIGSGAGSGILPALPENFRLGANSSGTSSAHALYDRCGFLTRDFPLTASVVDILASEYFPFGSNYFAAAELIGVRAAPVRPYPTRERYEYTLTVRKGVA